MRFVVLGTVAARVAGQEVPIARAQRRAVLAYLLLGADRAISAEQLVDALWGGAAPATARTQVHAAVSAIRTTLRAAAGRDLIASGPAGYRLAVDETTLDLAAFRARVDAARAADGPRSAATELRAALAAWSDEPLGGVAGAFVDAARTRLVEERLDAAERLYDIELELGRHAEIVGDLTALADAYPVRERLAAQLMTALSRGGRRAEALARYRSVRRLLVDEFGVEPGADLREAQRAVLADETARPPVAPRQLPPVGPTFVGRDRELADITARLSGGAIVALSGLGGIGKTSLAVRAAAAVASDYPDGCLFTDLRGAGPAPADPHLVTGGFLRALGVAGTEIPTDPDERLGLYRTVTAGRRLLVVLDNAHGEAQVRPLLPAGSGAATLVTSRRLLSTLDGAAHVTPSLLADADAVALLAAVAGADRLGGAGEELARRGGGLPLAVRILGARLVEDRTLAARDLAADAATLAGLAAGDLGVAASLRLSYDRMPPDAARLLARLARAAAADFTAWTATALLDRPAAGHLGALAALHLVQPASDGRFALHDLVRLFAADVPVAGTGLDRLADAYLDTVYQGGLLLSAGRSRAHLDLDVASPYRVAFSDRAAVMAWHDAECANIVATVAQCAALGWHERAWQLAYGMRFYLRAAYRPDEQDWLSDVALASAIALGDRRAEVRVLEAISVFEGQRERRAEQLTLLKRILDLTAEIGDRIGEARAHDSLAAAYGSMGRLDEAIAENRLALAIPEHTADAQRTAASRLNIGVCLAKAARYAEALVELDWVREVSAAHGDNNILCYAHHNLAQTHSLMGDHEAAVRHARAEIAVAGAGGDADRVARGYQLLGDVLAAVDPAGSVAAWREAISRFDARGDAMRASALRARADAEG